MPSTDETKNDSLRKIISVSLSVLFISLILVVSFFGGKSFILNWQNIYSFFGLSAGLSEDFSISFINVGSADACYIKSADTEFLIDTGSDFSCNKVVDYLKRYDCSHLDFIVISHFDNDHSGGLSDILSEFDVDKIYMPKVADKLLPDIEDYYNLLKKAESNNIELIYPDIPLTVNYNDMMLKFIAPLNEYEDRNNSSLVLKIEYLEISALFTGDIESEAEFDLLASNEDLNADILKVAHHGSASSSTEEFLEAVNPEISVVSVSPSDDTLPDFNTISRINHYSEKLFRTDIDGSIVINSDGKKFDIFVNN
ncbi:MAG: MBL fold metallo-hydrolase [Ruminococcus sp.]|nr:MBL fold metallo-hydrolase [Ruminococcus sp.]